MDARDVHHFIQGEYDLKTAIREQEVFLEEITEIKPFHQYDLSPQDWEYLLSPVENGEALCETSFHHLYSDGTIVSYDFCETWEITEEKNLSEIDQGR